MLKKMSKKELEEKRRREEEEQTASVFKEFVETFQNAGASGSKVWVSAGTFDAGSRKEDTKEKGKLYKPTPRGLTDDKTSHAAQEYAKMLASDSKKDMTPLGKKKAQEKKKSNLELFKEELKQMQEERQERHKYKAVARNMIQSTQIHTVLENPEPIYREVAEPQGSFDTGDPNTTNLYLGNLNPKITEQQLMELFGKFGPLASVKIMWPRSEEEKSRGRNCGFVAFMARKDAERALRKLTGKDVMGYEMRLGWGKAVPIMSQPIYVPPKLQQYAMPPPRSGLPFNAQPLGDLTNLECVDVKAYMHDEEKKKQVDEILAKSVVKIVIPTERPLLMLIHRMIEFVIREGPIFEAAIMAREITNPMFRFLYENESPSHIYYRWRLFSILQGDSPNEWSEKEFRMFKGASIWQPPKMNFFHQGMPEELISDDEIEPCKGQLSVAQRNRLEDLIRHLTPERSKIADAMIFCIEHAEAADEICDCIAESLLNPETAIHKKIARIYLVSDILHNCTVKVQNASFFRKSMERNLVDMFRGLFESYKMLESRLKAEGYKVRIMKLFRTWEEWAVYNRDFLIKLQNTFLGLATVDETGESQVSDHEDEDLDGTPLDGAALLKGALMRGIPTPEERSDAEEDDIDGVPLDENIDGIPLDTAPAQSSSSTGFVKSKWEELDPSTVAHQAITTSKWEFDPVAPEPPKISSICNYENSSSSDESDNEEKRKRLREIEIKIVEYQDELESGKRQKKSGHSISEQVEHYRRKLLRKADKHDSDSQHSTSDRYASSSSSKRDRNRRSSSSERRVKKPRRSLSDEREKYHSGSSKHARSRSPHSPSLSSKSSKHRRGRSRSFSNSPVRSSHGRRRSPQKSRHRH